MKIKSYLLAGLATFALASCDDSFNDWSEQPGNPQGEAVAFGNGSVAAVDVIDFAQITESTDSVQICNITKAPTSSNAAYTPKYTLRINYKKNNEQKTEVLKMGPTGKVKYADFKKFVENTYGKKPVVNDLQAKVRATLSMNGNTNASFLDSENFIIKAKPDAPEIASTYYVIGGTLNWAESASTKEQKFIRTHADVYDDPVFTAVIPANAGGETWFGIGSGETCDEIANKNEWKHVLGTTKGNGENGVGVEENLDTREHLGNDGSFKVSTDKKYIKIEINMMYSSYKITPVDYPDYISAVSGNSELMLRTSDGNNYCGGAYINGALKINGEEIAVSEPAGYYWIDYNTENKTAKLTAITTIGVIGDASPGKWDNDTDMTYNADEGCWEIKDIKLNDGNIKFRANDGWDINWGTNSANSLFSLDMSPTSGNFNAEAGTYDIKLYALCSGQAYAIMTKK